MRFTYKPSSENSQFKVTLNTYAYSDLDGADQTKKLAQLQDIKDKKSDVYGDDCFQILDKNLMKECKTFKVEAIFHLVAGDRTHVTNFKFGDESICSTDAELRIDFECTFEDGDCGTRNDACGLVAWRIRDRSASSSARRRSADCTKQPGISLLKKTIKTTCSYDHLQNIVDLQQSGFLVSQSSDADAIDSSRAKRSLGYELYLPAPENSDVGSGILDLPEVQYDAANAILQFHHEMEAGGFHNLMVTAICTSDPTNPLIPLDSLDVHYHKTNLDGSGSYGKICLDIHSYVDPTMCSTFVIQMQACVVVTDLIVDSIAFFDSIAASDCSK